MKRNKRLNTVMDCILITQFCTAVAAALTIVAHRIEIGYYAVSPDFLWFCLIPAFVFMAIPVLVFRDRLSNQCADDEQQAVLDITETIRMETEPHAWKAMWHNIRGAVRTVRELINDGVAASEGRLPNGLCNCHRDPIRYAECRHLGCPERHTGIYATSDALLYANIPCDSDGVLHPRNQAEADVLLKYNTPCDIGTGDMPDGDHAPVEHYVEPEPVKFS
jgi:hypothetical protein